MKRLIIAALALACVACTPTPPTSAGATPVETAADGVIVSGTRGLILANLLYQSIGTPVAVALEQGVITGSLKVKVQAADRAVIAALKAGRNAQDVAGKARAATDALAALDVLSALTGIKLPTF